MQYEKRVFTGEYDLLSNEDYMSGDDLPNLNKKTKELLLKTFNFNS